MTKDPASWRDTSIDYCYWFWGTFAVSCDRQWVDRTRAVIVDHQERAGSWPPVDKWSVDGGRVYATAINALTLLVTRPPTRTAP